MTATAQLTGTTTPSRTPLLAAFGVASALALTAIGTYWDITGNDSGPKDGFGAYLVVVGATLVMASIVFGLVVRTAGTGDAGRRAVVLGVIAVLSIAVAWAGFPTVLAAGAVSCALVRRDRTGSLGASGTAALVLSAVATIGAIGFAVGG